MKKVILSILAVASFGIANAQDEGGSQTSKGKILIEANTGFYETGSTGFYFSSSDGDTEYNLGLDGGYFIMDDLALKAGLGYGGFKNDDFDTNTISYKIGAKYYLMKKFPIGLDLTGASVKDADENPLWLGVQGGYAWFLSDNIAIEPGLRYNHSLNEDYTDKGVFQFNIGFALFF